MKVAVSSLGRTMNDTLDTRFGRAAYFLFVDSDTMSFEVINNASQSQCGGAGIAVAQLMIDHDVEAVITGQIGPNAMDVFKSTGILLYQGVRQSVLENINAFNANALERISGSGPAHAGQRR